MKEEFFVIRFSICPWLPFKHLVEIWVAGDTDPFYGCGRTKLKALKDAFNELSLDLAKE